MDRVGDVWNDRVRRTAPAWVACLVTGVVAAMFGQGAELLADSIFDARLMVDTIERLVAKPDVLESMRAGAGRVARPDAARAVADLVEIHGGQQ